MSRSTRRVPRPVSRTTLVSGLVALALAELVALLLAYKPLLAIGLTGACVAAAIFLYVRRPAVVWIYALPVLPLVNWVVYQRLGTAAAFATLGVVALVWATSAYRGIRYLARPTVAEGLLVLFVVMVSCSQIVVGSPDGQRFLIGAIVAGLMAYFALRRAFAAADFRVHWLWWSFVALTGILAVMGLFEGLTGHDLMSFSGGVLPVSGVEGVSRVNGPFPTDIEYAMTLVTGMAVVLSGWGGRPWETPWSRRAAAIVTALALGAVYFTYFRTTWALALVILFLWMRQRGMTAVAVMLIVVAICGAALGGQFARLQRSSIFETRVLSGQNVNGRLATNKKAIDIFRSRPVVGIGWSNFGSSTQSEAVNGVGSIDTPHDAYLGVLAELGLVGAILFLGACAAVIQAVRRLRQAASVLGADARWLASATTWIAVLFLIFSLDFQTLTLPFPVALFFGCGGMAAGVASRRFRT